MGTLGWSLAAAGWLVLGGLVAVALVRQGHPAPAALAAVPCWPVLLPLLVGRAAPARGGPHADRIHLTLDRLARACREHGEALDLAPIRTSLGRADARLARFDLLLADAADARPADLDRLRAARAETEADIEAVLAELVRLRLHLGLAELSADRGPLRGRLAELAARVGSWEEVDRRAP